MTVETRAAAHRRPEEPDEPGFRIGGYEILGRLGVGGMAEAFLAKAHGPSGYQRKVVVKRLLPHLGADPDYLRMFIAEAKVLGMLHHPNIVQVYDFGEDEGQHFLTLEFIDGPSLGEVMTAVARAGERIPMAVATYIAREVCRGLMAVHALAGPSGESLQAVHRDVTPSNIMMTFSGGVKLLDFGIAHVSLPGSVTRPGTIKGKPAYMAPEQIRGDAIDGRTDLFALGVVLHELLAAKPLFWGENDLAAIYQVAERPIPVPSTLRPDVPPALDAIVMRALERKPDARYQSAADMASDLDRVVVEAGLRHDDVLTFVAAFSDVRRRAEALEPTKRLRHTDLG